MEIIPVIDLLHGQVVHAKRGQRQHYEPIQSSLCDSSMPLDIVGALLELYPFNTLYIADLDAIQRHSNHYGVINAIHECYPNLRIWLDCGIRNTDDLSRWQALDVQPVIGSECIKKMGDYHALAEACHNQHILSLDFARDDFQGARALLDHPDRWPEKVIVMTLAQVGSNHGPDWTKLQNVLECSKSGKIYAAGGIRGQKDLHKLGEMGINGALIASALHSGRLTREEIADITQK